ncbi:MAG: alpha/beta hydrolase fold domain-containing protein [Bryobacteraceae bacterium]
MMLFRSAVAALFSATLVLAQPAPAVPDNVILDHDVQYASSNQRLAMDIVRPRTPGPHPTVICIHGGGFRAGRRESYLPLCIKLAQRGYVAATVSYRLAPKFQFPAPVYDVKAAVRFLRANAAKYTIDPERIGATGGSAGAHLALFLGLTGGVQEFEGFAGNLDQSSRVKCVVEYYGPTDFTKSYGKSVDAADVLPQFLGGDLEHASVAHRKASPLNWVTPGAVPILAVHGTVDRYVAYEQSQWLMDRLHAAGVEGKLETLEGSDHGLKGKDLERAEQHLFSFFDKHLGVGKEEQRLLVANHGAAGEVMEISWPSGRVLWRLPNQHGHDVQPLPGGGLLYTIGPAKKVVEVDANRHEVWSYSQGLEHPLAAQRLENGNTLIADARLGKVIEVTRGGKEVWKYESPDLANMRSRSARRTKAGTTIISVETAGKLIEVDRDGKIIWTFIPDGGSRRTPYQGQRLENGNTLVGLADPGELVEVDSNGKVVRSIAGGRSDARFGWISGTQPLPNGGVIFSDYTGKRIIEVDAAGRVVHELPVGNWGIASVATR